MTDTTASAQGLVIDEALWARLREAANAAAARAYAPYSKYHVGAAALVNDGRIVTGCNVENAGLGVTLCAECGLISDLVNGGGGRLVAFLCVNGDGEIISPCGRCRQILFEHGGNSLVLTMPQGVMTMNEVLPGAFGPSDLDTM
ncbi:cytidine deaminase [Schaalia canis]|uniref:Cytidine deaminase n=1 Tax=Schaalia canis TaxID=100469 RepID=A0A3P1SCF5_9ACTO|nr:cytidine deaminase [Schaalia canis]RRC94647.1 cytidine deaminase [Schaalia canis]